MKIAMIETNEIMNAKSVTLAAASILAAASFSIAQETPAAPSTPLPPQAAPALTAPSTGAPSSDNKTVAPESVPSAGNAAPAPAAVTPVPPPPPSAKTVPVPGVPANPPRRGSGTGASIQFRGGAAAANPTLIFQGAGLPAAEAIHEEVVEMEEPEWGEAENGEDPLGAALIEEDQDLNLEKAMNRYQSVVARFDRQRAGAAQAIFRMGECYRKLGRMEEAKVQYARILREFPDQPALTQASQRYLFKNAAFSTQSTGAKKKAVIPAIKGELYLVDGSRKIKSSEGWAPLQEEPFAKKEAGSDQLESLKKQVASLQEALALRQSQSNGGERVSREKAAPELALLAHQRTLSNLQKKLDSVSSDLELAKANLRNGEKQLLEVNGKLEAALNAKPEHLPSPADSDVQYAKLREEYTRVLLDKSADKERVEASHQKLQDYVAKLYIPTLQTWMTMATDQKHRLSKEVEEIEKVKMELRTEIEAENQKFERPGIMMHKY